MTGDSPILHIIARFSVPLSVLVAVQIFFQGHDNPGGGFVAGVLLSAAGAMHLLAYGMRRAARAVVDRVRRVRATHVTRRRAPASHARRLPPYLQEPVRMSGRWCLCTDQFSKGMLTPTNVDMLECSRLH